jgi:hypothetical protein
MPDLFHVVPVGDNTVFNGLFEGEDTTLGLGFITDIGVLLSHANHHTGVARATDDGREDSARSIISSETGFAHTGSVVNNKGLNIIVTHGELLIG